MEIVDKVGSMDEDAQLSNLSPTCCELVSPRGAVAVASILQTLLLTAFVGMFFWMKSEEFFHPNSPLSPIVLIISSIYFFCIICSTIGSISQYESSLVISTYLLQTFILFTDLIAISVVFCMAVGNRNEWLDSLPPMLVKEERFEKMLGPFWMYLSAISLHITVAANMCFLQSINQYIAVLRREPLDSNS
ncbi:hypothetical protein PMAYCL1PPCAC_23719 [Pristionchus mayeri]|uniref:Uncharacterized protein n=1 Tax=Pristionchus mayeri TaxID=1317129 RepID=A0AAN5CZH0_9BILA|nr:hypothetical protein PMAYCL1PPCAC_23719 [Pristionchus mayeri]